MRFLLWRGAARRRGAGVLLPLLLPVVKLLFFILLLLRIALLRWWRLPHVRTRLLILLLRWRIAHRLKSTLRPWLCRPSLGAWRPRKITRGRQLTAVRRRLQRLRMLIHLKARLRWLVWRLRRIARHLWLLASLWLQRLRVLIHLETRLRRFIWRLRIVAWHLRVISRLLRLQRLRMLIHLKARLLRLIRSVRCARGRRILFRLFRPHVDLRRPLLRKFRTHDRNASTHNRPVDHLRRRMESHRSAHAGYAGASRLYADVARDRRLNNCLLIHAHNVPAHRTRIHESIARDDRDAIVHVLVHI